MSSYPKSYFGISLFEELATTGLRARHPGKADAQKPFAFHILANTIAVSISFSIIPL